MSLSGKSILVTGAGGFIGRHLVSALAKQGAHVLATGHKLPSAARPDSAAERTEWRRLDVTDRAGVEQMVASTSPDVIFHLAAIVGGDRSAEALIAQAETTLGSTINVAYAAIRNSTPLVVHMGTSEEYGDGPVPFEESQPVKAISPYSAAKIAATEFLMTAGRSFGLPAIVVRPAVVYGPGQEKLLIPHLFDCYLSGRRPELSPGEQTRDFVYIDDVVNALVACGNRPDLAGLIFNICLGKDYTIAEVARTIAELCAYKGDLGLGQLNYRKPEVMKHLGSYERAKRMLDWEPKVDFKEGLARTHAWWRDKLKAASAPSS